MFGFQLDAERQEIGQKQTFVRLAAELVQPGEQGLWGRAGQDGQRPGEIVQRRAGDGGRRGCRLGRGRRYC